MFRGIKSQNPAVFAPGFYRLFGPLLNDANTLYTCPYLAGEDTYPGTEKYISNKEFNVKYYKNTDILFNNIFVL